LVKGIHNLVGKVGDISILVGASFEKDYICFFLLGMDKPFEEKSLSNV
jgi:hypothetical protein